MTVVQCPACGEHLTVDPAATLGSIDCTRCGRSVTVADVPAADAETLAAPVPPPADAPTLTAGDAPTAAGPTGLPAVAGYEVLGELGRGGMGVVYQARQFHPPRVVALKMILAGEHADPDQLARFRAEAGAVARLTHPAIVRIHQVAEWHPPDGGPTVPFLTLEYVEGPTLAERLRAGPPPTPAEAARLVRRLAEAAQSAHDQGVVHRDLKPGNVLLVGGGAGTLGDPKVVDFGLAKPLDGFGTVADGGPHTRTGAVLGTPSYMAPEQAAGAKEVGPAADVYALGAILYELLTGRPPFVGETTLETLLQVAHEEPVPPRRVVRAAPRDLETVCLKCLHKEPRRRYASAAELADDLGRFLAGEPVRVRPPGPAERAARWARRQKGVAYLAGGAAVALVAVLAVVFARPPAAVTEATTPPTDPTPPVVGGEDPVAEARRRVSSANNLKQIVLGLHNFHDSYNGFPPPAVCDKAGKPLLSWRVALLPFIEQDVLYKQFRLDEPWDSPHNKALIDKMPDVYALEGRSAGKTHYQAVVGPGAGWEADGRLGGPFGREGMRIASFTDGTSNTILVAEVANPVVWTKPEDATLGPTGVPAFGGVAKGGFNAGLADGSVTFVRKEAKPEHVRIALVRNDGLVLPNDWYDPVSARQTTQARTTNSVRGRVTFQGRPLPGGMVTFDASGPFGGASSGQFIQSDGTYSASLPADAYGVTITLANPPAGFPALPAKYGATATSGLTVVVKAGDQTIDFDLK